MWSILHIELRKKTIISLNNSIPPHIICVTFLLIMQLLWSFCLAKKMMKKKNSQNCQFYVQKKRWYFSLYFIVWSSSEIHCVPAKKHTPVAQKKELFSKKSSLNIFLFVFLDIYCIINCVFPLPGFNRKKQ